MATHDYTPDQALRILLSKIEEADDELARHVRRVIDRGKEVEEVVQRRRRRGSIDTHRVLEPLTPAEALLAVLDCLQAYFVEQPLYANSALAELASCGMSRRAASDPTRAINGEVRQEALTDVGVEKRAVIEVGGPTQISTTQTTEFALHAPPAAEMEEQQGNLLRLRQLLDFSGD